MSASAPERRLRLTVAYDGTQFHGWQVQPGLPSIQSELERAFLTLSGSSVVFTGSGRTDAGVHALAQVAAITTTIPIPCFNLRYAMNRLLPGSIRVTDVVEVPLNFHPRFDAKSKLYEYRIYRGEICPPFERPYVHHFPYPLDEEKMIAAAGVFAGEHDFRAFAATDTKYTEDHSMVRRIFESTLRRDGERLVYRVRGSGFLKHMVRNLVGALVEVGRGNLSADDLVQLMRGEPRTERIPTAPASGLFLVEVSYS